MYVVAVGKAVSGMCRVVEDMFGDDLVQGLAIIPEHYIMALKNDGRE